MRIILSSIALFLVFTSYMLVIPTTVTAEEKRNYSIHLLILKHLIMAQSSTEFYNTFILGTATKYKTQMKQETESTNDSSNPMGFIMKAINEYRLQNGLSQVTTSAEVCSFAATRAQEITSSFTHDGFQSRADNKSLPYSSWSGVTENIAMTSNYKEVVTMWANSSGHAANMRADTPYVCVRQYGNYFAYQGMKP